MSARFTVVMPCYNEEKNIPLILSRFKTVASQRQDVKLLPVSYTHLTLPTNREV